jgi:dihydroceramidase
MDPDVRMFHSGYWGPITATLDWCEVRCSFPRSPYYIPYPSVQANYQFSHYVAEMSNTFSNLVFIFISLYGARLSMKESLPTRYLVAFAVCPLRP